MKIPLETVERLERICMGLERIPKEKINPIIKDMNWLADELRRAFLLLEDVARRKI